MMFRHKSNGHVVPTIIMAIALGYFSSLVIYYSLFAVGFMVNKMDWLIYLCIYSTFLLLPCYISGVKYKKMVFSYIYALGQMVSMAYLFAINIMSHEGIPEEGLDNYLKAFQFALNDNYNGEGVYVVVLCATITLLLFYAKSEKR